MSLVPRLVERTPLRLTFPCQQLLMPKNSPASPQYMEILPRSLRLQAARPMHQTFIEATLKRGQRETDLRFLAPHMLLPMLTSDPLGLLRIPHYLISIPPLRRHGGSMVRRASARGITLLDVFHAGGAERVWEFNTQVWRCNKTCGRGWVQVSSQRFCSDGLDF